MTDERQLTDEQGCSLASMRLACLPAPICARHGRLASDAAFRPEVARWPGRPAPMLDEVAPVTPPPRLWGKIHAAVGGAANDNVISLQRRVTVWRGAAAR